MSTNDDIQDAATRHQVFVQRYAAGQETKAKRYIKRLIKGVTDRLGRDELTDYSRARLERLYADLVLYIDELNREYGEIAMQEALDFGQYEAEFNFDLMSRYVDFDFVMPTPAQLESAIFTDVMQLEPTKGYTIKDALADFGTKKRNQIVQEIRDGVALGSTIDQVTKNIQALQPMQQRQAATLARTITNRISTKARETTMRENSDVVDSYKWVATLDSRTSLICAGRDGKIYKDIDSNPKPPAHWQCRSTITYVVKPEYDLGRDIEGVRPSVGPDNKAEQVSGSTTYQQWLKRQPASFQDEILGTAKAKLFRKGNLTLDRFVDENGRELNIEQLRELDRMIEGTGKAPMQPQ